jgi:hypothetical protein
MVWIWHKKNEVSLHRGRCFVWFDRNKEGFPGVDERMGICRIQPYSTEE